MNYLEIKNKYETLENVFCPYLKEEVRFSSRGFRHLFYKNGQRKRSESEVRERVKYFDIALEVLKVTTTLQEKESRKEDINFFAFIAIIENLKLKVVIKKEGNGLWHFYSLIPHFITSAKRDFKKMSD